jgi:D-alanine-D-alanine ligase
MRKKIALIFGGPGSENEISISSSKLIFQNIDHSKYNVFLILMNFEKKFILIEKNDEKIFCKIKSSSKYDFSDIPNQEIYFVPGGFYLTNDKKFKKIDIVFNDIYGFPGESGELSGFFEILNISYVGSNLRSSALLMDKELTNIVASYYEIPILDFETAYQENIKNFEYYFEKFDGFPFFVKPSNGGSSIGVYKIKSKIDFENAIKKVFKFDKKIIIQKGLELPAELQFAAFYEKKDECKKIKIAPICQEIRPSKKHGFYSYEAKYLDFSGTKKSFFKLKDSEMKEKFYQIIEKLFEIFDCSFGGIDFFLNSNGEIYFNELNTLSWFPGIAAPFEACGIQKKELIDKLIENC